MRTGGLAVLAAMVLTGCQTTEGETITIQAVGGDYCAAKMPQPTPWNGSVPPLANDQQAWVLHYNKGGKLGGPWLAALVDTESADVLIATTLTEAQQSKFVSYVARSRIVGPGTNPPPPPCDYPLACAPMLVVMGTIALHAPDEAYAKALSCTQQK